MMLRNTFCRGCLNHSLYEWIGLISNLFVPLAIGVLSIVLPLQQENLNESQNEYSHLTSFNNRLRNLQSTHDEQKQIILNTYQQDLTNLILKYDSDDNFIDDDDDDDNRISLIIRTKTLHALRQLDPARKVMLIQLLVDSGIQHRINISHADLSFLIFPQGSFYGQLQFINIIARNISFKNIYLYQSNFSYSTLDDSLFLDSNCSYADFSYTSLQRTDWTNTDVTHAIFNYTNLHRANITKEQLAKVQSLQGAILPNGTTVIG
jgi:uncharacterized protein YjbI with pentapeptide repeats